MFLTLRKRKLLRQGTWAQVSSNKFQFVPAASGGSSSLPTHGIGQFSFMQSSIQDPYMTLIGSQELIAARPTEKKKFAGDPYTYREWRLMFDTNVDGLQGIMDRRKFSELLHWVAGTAHMAISFCKTIMDPSQAYRSALRKLEET